MNRRQVEAARNARELSLAKHQLINKVNQQVQQVKARGYKAELSPQLLRLIGVKQYRKRDLQNINRLASDSTKLSEYISVIDPVTNDLISGGQAEERYRRYQSSGIYHAVDKEELPKEADIVISNFISEAEKAFVDDTVYREFMNTLNALLNGVFSVVPESVWHEEHAGIFETKKRHDSRKASSVQHSQEYFVRDANQYMLTDIESAVARLIDEEGTEEVIKRMADAGENLIDSLWRAGIGYPSKSAKATQQILLLLLPKSVHDRAMRMDIFADRVDDFNGEELE